MISSVQVIKHLLVPGTLLGIEETESLFLCSSYQSMNKCKQKINIFGQCGSSKNQKKKKKAQKKNKEPRERCQVRMDDKGHSSRGASDLRSEF